MGVVGLVQFFRGCKGVFGGQRKWEERSKSSQISPLLVGMNGGNELVTVSAARLRELEALEAGLSERIEKAKQEAIASRDAERFRILHEKQKANPEPNKKRTLETYHKNKDEINAKRREAYRLKKEGQAKAQVKQAGSA